MTTALEDLRAARRDGTKRCICCSSAIECLPNCLLASAISKLEEAKRVTDGLLTNETVMPSPEAGTCEDCDNCDECNRISAQLKASQKRVKELEAGIDGPFHTGPS